MEVGLFVAISVNPSDRAIYHEGSQELNTDYSQLSKKAD